MANLRLKKLILEVVDNQLRDNEPPATKEVYEKLLKANEVFLKSYRGVRF